MWNTFYAHNTWRCQLFWNIAEWPYLVSSFLLPFTPFLVLKYHSYFKLYIYNIFIPFLRLFFFFFFGSPNNSQELLLPSILYYCSGLYFILLLHSLKCHVCLYWYIGFFLKLGVFAVILDLLGQGISDGSTLGQTVLLRSQNSGVTRATSQPSKHTSKHSHQNLTWLCAGQYVAGDQSQVLRHDRHVLHLFDPETSPLIYYFFIGI